MKRQKGSITVFLSLVLVLLFSFVLTTLEAARITGATAYLSMISKISSDSFFAHYYSPLFEEYGLFGVDAGYETTYFSKEKVEQQLSDCITFGLQEIKGGLLSFEEPSVSLNTYQTMLSNEGEGFLTQVKEQVALNEMTLVIAQLFDKEILLDVGNVGEVYQKQEETLQVTNTVTQEILRLMELVDGIRMNGQGILLDKEGKLQLCDAFIKQIACMSDEDLSKAYQNEEIFDTVQQGMFSPKRLAVQIKQLIEESISLKQTISFYDEKIVTYNEELLAIQQQLSLDLEIEQQEQLLLKEQELKKEKQECSKERDILVEHLDLVLMDASEQYDTLKRKLDKISPLIVEALKSLKTLEQKQTIAKVVVKDYETYLLNKKEELSEQLYEVFEKELYQMKLYVGMEQQGYDVEVMRQSLQKNQNLLQQLSLSNFSYSNLEKVNKEMEKIETRIEEYTVEGLWFTYGEICVAEETGYSIMETLEELLTTGLFSFVGIEKSNISDKKLTGQELPSKSNTTESTAKKFLECMQYIVKSIQEGTVHELLEGMTETSLNTIALELYFNQYFGSYVEEKIDSKLLYEREYLIFGKSEDQENLLSMILYLVAFRTLFTMIEILKTSQKMAQLRNMSAAVAGITGIPLLISMTQSAMLLLWSVEEALIETAAILQGKKLSILQGSGGLLSYQEILKFSSDLVTEKVNMIPTVNQGAGYEEYLSLFSFLESMGNKIYYAMDLIQENIRYQYRNSFRMRNVLIAIDFCTVAKLKEKYNTGLFFKEAYELNCRQVYSY